MTEGLELADEVALTRFGVGASLEVVGSEVLIGGLAAEDVPDDAEHRMSDGEDGLGFALGAEAATEPAVLRGEVGVAAGGDPR